MSDELDIQKLRDSVTGMRTSLQNQNKVLIQCINMLEGAGMGDGEYGNTLLGMCTEACEILKKQSAPVMNQDDNQDDNHGEEHYMRFSSRHYILAGVIINLIYSGFGIVLGWFLNDLFK